MKPPPLRRVLRAAASLAIVALLLPASAVAAPIEGSCASERAVQFTTDVPSELRTAGSHRFEYHITFTNPDGTLGEAYTENAITFQVGAQPYEGNVLLRLFRNWGRLPDGTLSKSVTTIDPAQAAVFYAFVSTAPDDTTTYAMSVRWETRKNHWSDWRALASSPSTSACVANDGLTRMAFGWAG